MKGIEGDREVAPIPDTHPPEVKGEFVPRPELRRRGITCEASYASIVRSSLRED
jgi:hypothetical protein